jgi:hypothetical protein
MIVCSVQVEVHTLMRDFTGVCSVIARQDGCVSTACHDIKDCRVCFRPGPQLPTPICVPGIGRGRRASHRVNSGPCRNPTKLTRT